MLIFQCILIILAVYNILYALSCFSILKAEKNDRYKEIVHKTMKKNNIGTVETLKLRTEISLSSGVAHLFTLLLINVFSLTLAPAILIWLGIYLIASLIRALNNEAYTEEVVHKNEGLLPPETIRLYVNILYFIVGLIACLLIGIGLVIWL